MPIIPISAARPVFGIRLSNPPKRSRFRVCVAWIMFPALINSNDLNSICCNVCQKKAMSAKSIATSFFHDLARKALPKAIPRIPTFSIVE